MKGGKNMNKNCFEKLDLLNNNIEHLKDIKGSLECLSETLKVHGMNSNYFEFRSLSSCISYLDLIICEIDENFNDLIEVYNHEKCI